MRNISLFKLVTKYIISSYEAYKLAAHLVIFRTKKKIIYSRNNVLKRNSFHVHVFITQNNPLSYKTREWHVRSLKHAPEREIVTDIMAYGVAGIFSTQYNGLN